jgi:hypothetical protein
LKSTRCSRVLLAGIETMHMIRNGQLASPNKPAALVAEQFYSLAYRAAATNKSLRTSQAIVTEPKRHVPAYRHIG